MTKKEIREKAQEEILHAVANALISFHEAEWEHPNRDEIEAEIKKQADRVAKMFGYSKAWHN